MPVHLIKASLRISAISSNSYSPKGYVPKLTCVVMGPTPECELVWTVQKPDGGDWLEARAEVPELGEEEGKSLEVALWGEEHEIAEIGECAFTLQAVNEIEGVDEKLHDGTFTVKKASDEEFDFGTPLDWMLPLGLVANDVHDDKDGPPLVATVFLGGDVQTHEIEAHLFHGKEKVATSSDTSTGWSNQSTGGVPLGAEVIFEFETVRFWSNIRENDPTWREDDHWLDLNPGDYEIRVARAKKLVRTIAFSIDDTGTLVTDGRIEPDVYARPTAWFVAEPKGDLDETAVDPKVDSKALERAAYGGDLATSALVWSLKGMYYYRTVAEAPDPDALDEATATALQGLVDHAETQIRNWEDDLANGRADSTQCEHVIIPECDAYEERRKAVDLPDDHAVTVLDEATTIGATTARVLALRERAKAFMQSETDAHEGALAPFRAVLANDKLAIFEDHPADSFEYLTSNKKLIETPEELAEAEYWYFEGLIDIDAEAEIDGEKIRGKVGGWRVLGYRFDADGNTIDEWEEQGTGSSSPKRAYQHHKQAGDAPVAKPAKTQAAKKK
jgi:hypothetical protein